MSLVILKFVLSALSVVGAWWLGKFMSKWINEYKDSENAKEATDARAETEVDTQKADEESDALKKIDGR